MSKLNDLINILKYKEPNKSNVFRFSEDEEEDYIGEGETLCQKIREDKEKAKDKDNKNQNKDRTEEEDTEKSNKKKDQDKYGKKDFRKQQVKGIVKPKEVSQNNNEKPEAIKEVSSRLFVNLEKIKSELNVPVNQDVIIRKFKVLQKREAFIVVIDGMADKVTVNDYLLRQLMIGNKLNEFNEEKDKKDDIDPDIDYIANNLITINQIKKEKEFEAIIKQILNGLCALFIEGYNECIIVESRGYETRSVTTPQTESVVKGSYEAFIENLRTNLTLVRKIIRNKNLITEILPTGKVDNVSCAVVYMKEIANPKVVDEVKRRIESLSLDFIPSGGIMEQLIEDHPFSLIPQVLSTERPDRAASLLMEGHVAIICDGTPSANIVPMTFYQMMHTTEDTNVRWPYGIFLRVLRMVSLIIALLVPGFYAALNLYHQEMIPTELLMSLYKTRESTPFPVFIEIILMELSFEIIREAGVRVPGVIGQTLGIIGAIVLGEAAVSAALVSPALIIVIAITGLCGFVIPSHSLSFGIRISRFLFTTLGGLAGFYGLAIGIFIFGAYHTSIKTFGVPLFSPVAPKTKSGYNEVLRGAIWSNDERPDYLNTKNRKRTTKPFRTWEKEDKGSEKS